MRTRPIYEPARTYVTALVARGHSRPRPRDRRRARRRCRPCAGLAGGPRHRRGRRHSGDAGRPGDQVDHRDAVGVASRRGVDQPRRRSSGIATDLDGRILGRRPGEQLPRGTCRTRPASRRRRDRWSCRRAARRRFGRRSRWARPSPRSGPSTTTRSTTCSILERRSDTLYTVAGIAPLPDPASVHGRFAIARGCSWRAAQPSASRVSTRSTASPHLEQLAVLPGYMRHGIGTSLLEAACAWAAEHGYRRDDPVARSPMSRGMRRSSPSADSSRSTS